MGFGRGIDSDARRGTVLDRSAFGWVPATVAALRTFRRAFVVVPAGTPPMVDLRTLTAPDPRTPPTSDMLAARDAHARKLVLPLPGMPGLAAQRSLVGDARDLLALTLRQALPEFGGDAPATPMTFHDGAAPPLSATSPATLVVHVGATADAQDLLRLFRGDSTPWNGDLGALDGDGVVNLLVVRDEKTASKVAPSARLILAGGSAYGTYFAVSTFLQTWLGVRWLFPGALGTVIPAPPRLASAPVNAYEEPAVRSRTLAAVSSEGVHTAGELDEIRAWQLRNRLRPHQDLAKLFQKVHPTTASCSRPLPDAFTWATLEVEERVPSDHVINTFLSPYKPVEMSSERRIDGAGVDHYPELRYRHATTVSLGLPTEYTWGARVSVDNLGADQTRVTPVEPTLVLSSARWLSPLSYPVGLGRLGSTITFEQENDPCVALPRCCPVVPAVDGRRSIVRAADGPGGLVANYQTALGDTFSHRVSRAPVWEGDAPPTVPVLLTRFIPRAFEHHLTGDLVAFSNWHPCIFDYDTSPAGTPRTARARLVRDIAPQVSTSALGRQLRGRDLSHSVSFCDLDTWCQCDACVRVDDDGGPGNDLTHYRESLLARPSIALEREAGFSPEMGVGTLDAAALAARTHWLGHGLGGMRGGSFVWESRPALNPFRDMNLDELTARGVLWSQGYPRTRTRRVLTLLNAVCAELERAQAAPVLGFHAYAQYMAPPMRAPGLGDPMLVGESCHSLLMPYMTGVRDTLEYQPGATNPYEAAALPPATVGALGRMLAAPDQFNHERWSRIARQTGYYEYITSAGYVGPHLYSARLHAAVRRGLRHHGLRGFISETTPNWCFDAPMLWELPRMLWDPGPLVGAGVDAHLPALRGDFCAAAFGPAAAPMQAFFDLCEEAWAATRDEWKVYETDGSAGRTYPDRRLRSGASSGLCGDGYGGRGAKITTLDGFFGAPRGGGARNRLLGCWQRLNAAYDTPGLDELSRSRVQLFRRGFGLTLLIGLWYEPVQKAFEMIRRHRYDLARMRKMAVVVGAAMHAWSETRPTESNVRDRNNVLQQVTVLTSYSDEHPSRDPRLQIPPRTPAAALSPTDRALRDAAAARINPERTSVNGLRSLRNQVHRYLALSHAVGASDAFPTFREASLTERDLGHLRDVGLGLFDGISGVGPLADDAPFPAASVAIAGPHRLVGLDLFYLTEYINWWNAIEPREMGDARARAVNERIQLQSHITSNPGLGWCFQGIREAAGMVAVQGFDAVREGVRRDELLFNIVRG